MEHTDDFNDFNPQVYLDDYYSEMSEPNAFLLDFYHKVYSEVENGSLLEIGGGPTIYQLISASAKVNKIVFSEFLEANRNEILKFQNKDADAFDWDIFFKYVLKLENKEDNPINVYEIKQRLREKIADVVKCDLTKGRPVSTDDKFDIISINFCPESITDNEKVFIDHLRKSFNYLKSGGLLVFTALRNATSYSLGDISFPAFPVNEDYLKKLLKKEGFKDIKADVILFEDETMDGNVAISARKA